MSILTPDYSDLDYDAMASEIGLKPKHMPMLIGSFLEESDSIMNPLGEAISKKDMNAIKAYAHSIKGSAGNLKFQEIYEMAKAIELAAADTNDTFDYEGYFQAIKVAIQTIPS